MTAKTLVRERATEEGVRELTAKNIAKVTRYRSNGMEELEREVKRMEARVGDKELKEVSHEFFFLYSEGGGDMEFSQCCTLFPS